MKRKNLLSIALVLLLVAITSLTFAYWDDLTGSKGGNVQVGEGKRITITDVVPTANQRLIPDGALKANEDDVYKISIQYKVEVTELVDNYELVVTATTTNGLVNVNVINPGFTKAKEQITVTLEFTLTMPDDKAEYDSVAGKQVGYTVNFDYQPAV